jgi:hypothetical protein
MADYLRSNAFSNRLLVTGTILPPRKKFFLIPATRACSHDLAALAQERRNVEIVPLEVRDRGVRRIKLNRRTGM